MTEKTAKKSDREIVEIEQLTSGIQTLAANDVPSEVEMENFNQEILEFLRKFNPMKLPCVRKFQAELAQFTSIRQSQEAKNARKLAELEKFSNKEMEEIEQINQKMEKKLISLKAEKAQMEQALAETKRANNQAAEDCISLKEELKKLEGENEKLLIAQEGLFEDDEHRRRVQELKLLRKVTSVKLSRNPEGPNIVSGYIVEPENTVKFEFKREKHSKFHITNELWSKMSCRPAWD